MKERLRFFANNRFEDVDLTDKMNVTVGSDSIGSVVLHITDYRTERVVFQRSKKNIVLKFPEGAEHNRQIIKSAVPKNGDIYILDKENNEYVKYISSDTKYENTVNLNDYERITVGRSDDKDLVLNGRDVSRDHALIHKLGGVWYIRDNGSKNGIYINSAKASESSIKEGDTITIANFTLVYTSGLLKILGNNSIQFNGKKKKRKISAEYPIYRSSPRIKYEYARAEINIQPPPSRSAKPEINWLTVLLPPSGMLLAMCLMAVMMGTFTCIFMLPMTLISIITSIVNYRSQVKKHEETENLRFEKYRRHLEDAAKQAEIANTKYHTFKNNAYPKAEDYIKITKDRTPRFWEKRTFDDDFLETRIGTGSLPADFKLNIPSRSIEIHDDYLKLKPERIQEDFKEVADMPITVNLNNDRMYGIVGDRETSVGIAKNIILSLAASHKYTEVKFVIIFDKKEQRDWMWTRWLPHAFDDERSERYLACTEAETRDLMKGLSETMSQRARYADEHRFGHMESEYPFFVFVVAKRELLNGAAGINYILSGDKNLNTALIFLGADRNEIPGQCRNIVETSKEICATYRTESADVRNEFRAELLPDSAYYEFARCIAPVRMQTTASESQLPGAVTFFEGCGVKTPEQFNIAEKWTRTPDEKNMAVPIGRQKNGDNFCFNIKKQGPHGLVAGMTGSGKSEAIQTWILSMALSFSPENISFVLIDFKGEGLILPFKNLPHIAGTISNTDKNIARNMISLKRELVRREELFSKTGVTKIDDYMQLCESDDSYERVPYLFVVVDEFAELKSAYPEFMDVIKSIFRIGRSLGVHIILMAQKPAGVISDEMRANTGFSWCLKVKDAADSKEMLQRPDAVKIINPGRVYIKVGEFEVYELIQSFWSGAPYRPDREDNLNIVPQISAVDLRGNRVPYKIETGNTQESTKKHHKVKQEIDVITDYITNTSKSLNISQAHKIWTPPLPEIMYLADIIGAGVNGGLKATVGLADAPERQSRTTVELNMPQCGHIMIYGAPGTGKTTFIQTYIMSLLTRYDAEYVNIYIMDFGGMHTNIFKDYPQVGGIVNADETEKAEKLSAMILKEISLRKKLFSQVGVANLKAYNEFSKNEKLPYIVLAVDNFDPILGIYPELNEFFQTLTHDGSGYGVYFVSTATNLNAGGYKMSHNIKTKIALNLIDKSDYVTVVGRTNGVLPGNNIGRGLIRQDNVHEFQTALPESFDDERGRALAISDRGKRMSAEWTGKRARNIPVMPEEIPYGSVFGAGAVIGLSTADILPVEMTFDNYFLASISNMKQDAAEILCVIVRQAREKFDKPRTIVIDTDISPCADLKEFADEYIMEASDIDKFAERLVPELNERREKFKSGAADEFNPIFIVITQWKKCYEIISDQTAKRFAAIARLGEGLNVNVIISASNSELSSMYHQGEPLTLGAVKNGYGIILGGSLNDHPIYDASDIPLSQRGVQMPRGEGYITYGGHAERFKAMRK